MLKRKIRSSNYYILSPPFAAVDADRITAEADIRLKNELERIWPSSTKHRRVSLSALFSAFDSKSPTCGSILEGLTDLLSAAFPGTTLGSAIPKNNIQLGAFFHAMAIAKKIESVDVERDEEPAVVVASKDAPAASVAGKAVVAKANCLPKKRRLTLVTGATGSGKTSLLQEAFGRLKKDGAELALACVTF